MQVDIKPRIFVITMDEEEVKHLRKVLGDRTGTDAEKQGLDMDREYHMFDALDEALDHE